MRCHLALWQRLATLSVVATVILVRHGRTPANVQGVLAGWTPGVSLDETGREQARAAAARLEPVRLSAVVSSPLERTRETASEVLAAQPRPVELHIDERVGEAHYGDWTGCALKDLSKDPMWKVVQGHASAAVFPGGESLPAMQARAVDAVREWNARLGDKAVYALVSHGDVIKAILADALGMHLDHFQRIVIDPASVSVVHYTSLRPFVLRVNDMASDLSSLNRRTSRKRSRDATVGGGAGEA